MGKDYISFKIYCVKGLLQERAHEVRRKVELEVDKNSQHSFILRNIRLA